MKPKILITQPIPESVTNYLKGFFEIECWEQQETIPKGILYENVRDIQGLMNVGIPINEELLSNAPNLKVVSNISAGYNNFSIEDMRNYNVVGTNTPGVLDETVNDLVFGLILSTARRISELDSFMRAGKWQSGDDSHLFGLDVHGRTLGIIGLGRIGESICKRAIHGFGMNVLYHNRSRKSDIEEQLGITYASMDELLSASDFIVLMTPLTKETHHLIGEKEFAKMKNTAIFINASRGPTVDEQALINALKEKQIFGAGLDVFEQEPIDPNNPLLQLENVVLTPHIGSATTFTRENMAKVAAENLVEILINKNYKNVVKEFKDKLHV
ncbi:2-hydroxyacid dehydrogenase [Bacillus sp. Marseille-P3661]|uniref:2-hydroxyacid dehydrogenase n=1 Tax=Bacillus sp. Marseille-P3661 TaxID=1936234 RepID=UPI000C84A6C0|nr:D-glycerate dehydrogenase [Bacillus sp. Marseille-P3661]